MANVEHHYGAYLITGRGWGGEDGTLVQTDYDYPATAGRLGWSLRRVRAKRPDGTRCEHSGTDGTVDCRECGTTASTFIAAAAEYLDSKAG